MNSAAKSRPSSDLRFQGDAIWMELHKHPFVQQIGNGTPEAETFSFFIEQDYKYLVEYGRVLSYGAARSHDLTTMQYFSHLLQVLLDEELPRCKDLAAALGIEISRLQDGLLAPATQAYTDFLLLTASQGDSVELPAAILPCTWSYVEIGQAFSSKHKGKLNIYQEWIHGYASPEMVEMSDACRDLVDRSIRSSGQHGMELATKAFLTSSRYELAFWEAVFRREGWLV